MLAPPLASRPRDFAAGTLAVSPGERPPGLARGDQACEPAGVPPNPVTIAPDQAPPLRGEPVARSVFTGLPGRYDRLAYLLSFGQDRRWRAAVVSHTAAASPGLVLDVATGPAGIALAVAGRTGADVVGVDLNEPMLRAGLPRIRSREQKGRGGAWTEERQASLRAPERRGKASPSSGPEASGRAQPGPRGRVRVAAGRADQLPFADATFDAVTFSYLLRYVDDPAATIAEMARCLRPGGTLACLEFYVPPRPAWVPGGPPGWPLTTPIPVHRSGSWRPRARSSGGWTAR